MSLAILVFASSLMVAAPFFNWSWSAAMSDCFFSSAALVGPNLAPISAWAFWPSLVANMACWMAIIPTFVGTWSWSAAMSDCFFSSAALVGPNLAPISAWAFWPSLVANMACWMAIIPTFVGTWVWAFASAAIPKTNAE